MGRSIPRDVRDMVHITKENNNLHNPQTKETLMKKLRKLFTSKKVWYIVLVLALGAAGWQTVKRFMELQNLKGIGMATVSRLESVGRTLGVPKTTLDAQRLKYLDDQLNQCVTLVSQDEITVTEAMRRYKKLFKRSDPTGLYDVLGMELAKKLDRVTGKTWFGLPTSNQLYYSVARTILSKKSNVSKH